MPSPERPQDGPAEVEHTTVQIALVPDTRITFGYLNFRHEVSVRNVRVLGTEYGTTRWHPKPQWFLAAIDLEKNEKRLFAMLDMSDVRLTP